MAFSGPTKSLKFWHYVELFAGLYKIMAAVAESLLCIVSINKTLQILKLSRLAALKGLYYSCIFMKCTHIVTIYGFILFILS